MDEFLNTVFYGDCFSIMKKIEDESIDLVYLDPPFFTNKNHISINRDRTKKFSFSDIWSGFSEYAQFIECRLVEIQRILKKTGSVFVHCDKSANFLIRALLDSVFGSEQFRSEIVWTYRRWSNSAKGLLPSHQTIFHYSKSTEFKFNKIYGSYSETTNIDQILQLRARDEYGVSSYATNEKGEVIYSDVKKGVPLSDVWDIPYLNPKAKERTGYPTQKPVLLLEQIVEISTDPGDIVLDPFCGSGTTLVAASLLNRKFIGIDISEEAVNLSKKRLEFPEKTNSALLKNGRASYENANKEALELLQGLDFIPVQRNIGIDAFLRLNNNGNLLPIKIQKKDESLLDAAQKLHKAAVSKKAKQSLLIRTHDNLKLLFEIPIPSSVIVIDAPNFQINQKMIELFNEDTILAQ